MRWMGNKWTDPLLTSVLGDGQQVQSLMFVKQVFLWPPQSPPPSKVPWGIVLGKVLCRVTWSAYIAWMLQAEVSVILRVWQPYKVIGSMRSRAASSHTCSRMPGFSPYRKASQARAGSEEEFTWIVKYVLKVRHWISGMVHGSRLLKAILPKFDQTEQSNWLLVSRSVIGCLRSVERSSLFPCKL